MAGETVADRPELAAQLDPLAGPADGVSLRMRGKVAWKCPQGEDHRWEAAPYNRAILGQGCPFCSGRRPSAARNLAVLHPTVAAELAPDLNGGLLPQQVTAGSKQRLWWRCATDPDHVWDAVVHTRTKTKPKPAGCPYCSGNRLDAGRRSLAVTHPQLAAELDPGANEGLDASQVSYGSSRKVWWRCPQGPDHRWQASVNARTSLRNPTGCPCCSGYQLSVTNSLAALHPHLAAQVDPALNDGLTADQIPAGTSREVTWSCPKAPDHRWTSPVVHRTSTGNGCPYCAGRRSSTTNQLTRWPKIAAQFDLTRNHPLTPDQVNGPSRTKRWWLCPAGPDHDWQASPGARTGTGATGCPYCAGHLVSVTNALATRAPDIAAELDPALNHGLTARDVTAGSSRNLTWRCRSNPAHTWSASPGTRTGALRTGCPHCKLVRTSRRQLALGFELQALIPDTMPTGATVRAGGRNREIDILMPRLRVAIEFDGHHWHSQPGSAQRDQRKSEALRAAGYTLIRAREQPLPLLHPHDVQVPVTGDLTRDTKSATLIVLARLADLLGLTVPGLEDYAATPALLGRAAYEAHCRRQLAAAHEPDTAPEPAATRLQAIWEQQQLQFPDQRSPVDGEQ